MGAVGSVHSIAGSVATLVDIPDEVVPRMGYTAHGCTANHADPTKFTSLVGLLCRQAVAVVHEGESATRVQLQCPNCGFVRVAQGHPHLAQNLRRLELRPVQARTTG